MPADRRQALGLFGAALATLAGRTGATSIALPPLELGPARLTQGGWARGMARGGLALDLDGRAIPCDASGAFFLAFDRDAAPVARLTGRAANGWVATRDLAIAPRAWQIEHVDAPLRPPSVPSEQFLAIRKAEPSASPPPGPGQPTRAGGHSR